MPRRLRHMRVAALIALSFLALVVVLSRFIQPPRVRGLQSHPHPARNYAEAVARWRAIEDRDSIGVNPVCMTRRLDRGARTPHVIVLFHGLTNCPAQFETFGERLHAHGWNVLIARIPHHGLADRMTEDLERLDAAELARFTDEVIDIAHGFGEHVTVAGLSLGGVMAAWAGQERSDVDRAVVIAPFFGVSFVPSPFTAAFASVLLALPNQFVWWNAREKQALAGPPQTYPRFATRAVGETIRLGLEVQRAADAKPPAARELVIVSLDHDHAINNGATAHLVACWKRAGASLRTYEFPARLELNHDLIDPRQVQARVDLVYPVLERLILR